MLNILFITVYVPTLPWNCVLAGWGNGMSACCTTHSDIC